MSPTLNLLVQREADIQAFVTRPFYVPEIICGGFTASHEKLAEKAGAETICRVVTVLLYRLRRRKERRQREDRDDEL